MEAFEPRVLLSTWTVANLNDSGPGSLRDAIQSANAQAGDDTVTFAAGLTGTITLTSGQLEISDTTAQTTIAGPGAGALSVSGNNASRVFSIDAGAVARISGLTITRGMAHTVEPDGGGILNHGTLQLADSAISGNAAPFAIGGGVISYHVMRIERCTFTNNSAGFGAAVDNETGTMTIGDTDFSHNVLSQIAGPAAGYYGWGAAIDNFDGDLAVTGSTFVGNVAPYDGRGGGITNESGASLHVGNCTFFGNSALQGGAIDNEGNNSGVAINKITMAAVSDSTIFGNSASLGGGIFNASSSPRPIMDIHNTIVAGNTSRGSTSPSDVYGTATGSYNLIGDGAGQLSAANHNLLGTPTAPLDPRLASLANYGGPTETMALLAGSPALDAGSNALAVDSGGNSLTTDQRGLSRVFNGTVDIGAYEAQPPAIGGDVNHDGAVSFSDLLLLAQHYGTAQPLYEGGDLTGDGTVDFSDLLLLAQNYGQSSMPAAAASSTPSTVSPTDVWSVLGRRKRTAHPVLSDFSQAGPPT